MPRVWHQPILGKVNTWMFLQLEHGRCLRNMYFFLLHCFCDNNLLGVWDPTWSDFQLLLIPCFGYYIRDPSFLQLKEKFTLLSRAPNSLGSYSLSVSSLCVFMDMRIFLGIFCFGLVGIYIKTYSILRYARFVIKYSNRIFELCVRFLSWQYFWNRIHQILFLCLNTIYTLFHSKFW